MLSRFVVFQIFGWIFLLQNMPMAIAWTTTNIPSTGQLASRRVYPYNQQYLSTMSPFEAEFFASDDDDDDDESNPFAKRRSPLAVPPDTPLVVGLNKYTHDTTLCAAHAETGQVLFAVSKERLTRRKHDAGNALVLVDACLEALDLGIENIQTVVSNNHHHRILPHLEANRQHMEWESGLRINAGAEDGTTEDENLLPDAHHQELSHHLAHAYSTASQAPFSKGVVVVMDGMGETLRTMLRDKDQDDSYTSDFSFGTDTFTCVPSNVVEKSQTSYFDWREAESVYTFLKTDDGGIDIRPVFKRFTEEKTPPTLYNHGFENMESVGAVYSRASSHIFSNWNACGKVMGLAPWASHMWIDPNGHQIKPSLHTKHKIISGNLHEDDGLKIDRSLLEGMPLGVRTDPDLFDEEGNQRKRYDFDDNDFVDNEETQKRIPARVALEAIALAHRVQVDLEETVLDFVKRIKKETGETRLCLAGGVALNSVLNGRLARELGFEQVFISPYPGDDGIAVGCCAYGLFGNKSLNKKGLSPVWKGPLSPYLGAVYSDRDIRLALAEAESWLEVDVVRDENQRLEIMAREIERGGVIAWYRSRSELGPRALGHRSIIADPRKKDLVRFINEHVKSRESFRPFAPSVLAEEAREWFDLGLPSCDAKDVSPYMSLTAMVKKDKRVLIPAVTHVDGSSRLQIVSSSNEPLYHKFIQKFFDFTGVPLVLNTSFNTLPSEPIVETPADAIRSFLYSMGSLEMLVLEDRIIRRKKPDLRKLLGESGQEPARPVRAGPMRLESTLDLDIRLDDTNMPTTRVRMPARPMHGKGNEWFTLIDELEGELLTACDGTRTLNEVISDYTTDSTGRSFRQEDFEEAQVLLQNMVQRLVRLYEHTLIRW